MSSVCFHTFQLVFVCASKKMFPFKFTSKSIILSIYQCLCYSLLLFILISDSIHALNLTQRTVHTRQHWVNLPVVCVLINEKKKSNVIEEKFYNESCSCTCLALLLTWINDWCVCIRWFSWLDFVSVFRQPSYFRPPTWYTWHHHNIPLFHQQRNT